MRPLLGPPTMPFHRVTWPLHFTTTWVSIRNKNFKPNRDALSRSSATERLFQNCFLSHSLFSRRLLQNEEDNPFPVRYRFNPSMLLAQGQNRQGEESEQVTIQSKKQDECESLLQCAGDALQVCIDTVGHVLEMISAFQNRNQLAATMLACKLRNPLSCLTVVF